MTDNSIKIGGITFLPMESLNSIKPTSTEEKIKTGMSILTCFRPHPYWLIEIRIRRHWNAVRLIIFGQQVAFSHLNIIHQDNFN